MKQLMRGYSGQQEIAPKKNCHLFNFSIHEN